MLKVRLAVTELTVMVPVGKSQVGCAVTLAVGAVGVEGARVCEGSEA